MWIPDPEPQPIAARAREAVRLAPVFDIHTHLAPATFEKLCLWGIDELLTYHYLIAETLRARPDLRPEEILSLPKEIQAESVWHELFVVRPPVSEATNGVLTTLTGLGIDPRETRLDRIREAFASNSVEQQIDRVFQTANVTGVTMTNDPFDPVERAYWEQGGPQDPRFLAALRIDPIVNHFATNVPHIRDGSGQDLLATRRFLSRWIGVMKPLYMAVSLPSDFKYPHDDDRTQVLREAVIPICLEHSLPLALMIGVKRGVNPRMGTAGDGGATADLASLEHLASEFPSQKFLVTTLMRENTHDLCVIARKFNNVLPFGCWWFMNNPSLIEETTKMRLEMLGTTFVPQHSDARILEQLVYKWSHSREAIGNALAGRLDVVEKAGRSLSDAEVLAEAERLMSGNARQWLGLP